jgi:hypothetical protein
LAGAPVSYSVTMFTTFCGTMKIDLIVRFSTYFATGGNARACARIVASELENLLMKARQDTARFCCGV